MPAQEPKNSNKLPKEGATKKDGLNQHNVVEFLKKNTKETIAYVILVLGIILLFVQPFLGSFLLGIIGGYFFATEILFLCKNGHEFIEEQGIIRSVVLGFITLAFFIVLPGIFIGAAASLTLRYFFGKDL